MAECTFQPAVNPYPYHSCHYSSSCSRHPHSSSQEKRGRLLDDTTRAETSKQAGEVVG